MSDLRFKKMLLIGISAFLLFHVAISLIFSFPEGFQSPVLQKMVFRYMFPFFNQSNRVFAPDPPLFTHHLKYSVKKGGVWSNWKSMTDSLNKLHYKHRFSPVSTATKLADYQYFRIYDAILVANYQVDKKEDLPACKADSIRRKNFSNSAAFLNVFHYLRKKNLLPKDADSIRFLVEHQFPPEPDSHEVIVPIIVKSPSVAISP